MTKDNAIMQTSPSDIRQSQPTPAAYPHSGMNNLDGLECTDVPDSFPLTLEMLRAGLDDETVAHLRQALNIHDFCVELVRHRETIARQSNAIIKQDAA